MKIASIRQHFWALLLACVIVVVVRPQKIDIKPLLPFDSAAYLIDYTPYFPGLAAMYKHEIFAPEYAHTKKIVILGASSVVSIGCDFSWHTGNKKRDPANNAHNFCSVTGQLNEILKEHGYDDWHAFNLARDDAKLTHMLFTYARVAELKPELVIYGDAFPHHANKNAGAVDLDANMYGYLDQFFEKNSEAATVWHGYRDHLAEMGKADGWKLPTNTPDFTGLLRPTNDLVNFHNILVHRFAAAQNGGWNNGFPWPVAYWPQLRGWEEPKDLPFENPDPHFDYLQGFKLFQLMQENNGGKFMLYYSPLYEKRNSSAYINLLRNGAISQYLDANKITHLAITDLPLQPIYDTYDGVHQTLYGNHKIAQALYYELEKNHMLY